MDKPEGKAEEWQQQDELLRKEAQRDIDKLNAVVDELKKDRLKQITWEEKVARTVIYAIPIIVLIGCSFVVWVIIQYMQFYGVIGTG